ncbi:Pre-mRNA-splicing factor ISY1-like [Gryllus bimaculatus]|nr:Pre-mRNA-splicing factor ISY1-like [Gryllus bimaculatus]
MARNAEKAMTTLARWRAAQVNDMGKEKERRPYLASECHDLPKAEKWRLQIIREIAKKVAQIQNAIQRAVSEWKSKKEAALNSTEEGSAANEEEEENIYAVPDHDSDEDEPQLKDDTLQPRFIAHVPVPSQREVEEALLRRKKQELLDKYASDSLIKQSEEAMDLLGVNNR